MSDTQVDLSTLSSERGLGPSGESSPQSSSDKQKHYFFQLRFQVKAKTGLASVTGRRVVWTGSYFRQGKRGNTMADLAGVLKELEQERRRLDQVIQVIGNLVRRNGTGVRARRPKRTLSASARRKIAAAQRARWAKVRARQLKKAA